MVATVSAPFSTRVPRSVLTLDVPEHKTERRRMTPPFHGERIAAVVDWEMSTLGDPLTDVALMCVYRTGAFDQVLGFSAAWTSDRYASVDEIAQTYSTATGVDLGDWDFYLGLANLKLGVIAEGITYRALSGASSGDGAEKAAEATAAFIADGLRHIS